MRAWRVHELGNPDDVLKLEDVEQPTPGPGQVLVKVRAAALNFFDNLMIQGLYQEKPPLPFTPGSEVCGEIAETGQRGLRGDRGDRAAGPRVHVGRSGRVRRVRPHGCERRVAGSGRHVRREG